MKAKFLDQKNESSPSTSTPTMFSKLPSHHFPHLHPFHLSNQTSDDIDSRSSGAAATPTTPNIPKLNDVSTNDGASIEVVRRPRGRPPGSKNKAKPPVIITRETEPSMSPYILEISGGNDVVEAISKFCRRKNLGLCVLTGSGAVANVTLRQPSTTSGGTVTFHGRFDILSITATFFPPTSSSPVPPNGFTISLAGPQGQIVGGPVAGALLAAGTVYVVAASFNNPSYHRLPIEEDVNHSVSGGVDGESPTVSGSGEQQQTETGRIGMYSHLPTDVIWAPSARQPPPPY